MLFQGEGFKIEVQQWEIAPQLWQVRVTEEGERDELVMTLKIEGYLPEVQAARSGLTTWVNARDRRNWDPACRMMQQLNERLRGATTQPEELKDLQQQQQDVMLQFAPRGAIPPPPRLGPDHSLLSEIIRQLARVFHPGGHVTTPTELVRAIAEARKQGLTDIEEDLRKQLKDLTKGKLAGEAHTSPPPPGYGSGWVGTPEGVGTAPGDASDIPRRSRREVARADDYFNEAEHQLSSDYQELEDMFTDAEEAPARSPDEAGE